MSRTSTLILFGILTVLIPFSGLPVFIRTFLIVICGACVTGIGFSLRTSEVAHSAASAVPPAEPSASEPAPPQGVSPV